MKSNSFHPTGSSANFDPKQLDGNHCALFTYGSLMFEPVWTTITHKIHPSFTGCIDGFKRKTIERKHYPGIQPDRHASSLKGVIYYNLTRKDLQHLDAYEGELYRRVKVNVRACDVSDASDTSDDYVKGSIFDAYVYVVKPEFYNLMSNEDWCPDHFQAHLLPNYVQALPSH